MTNKKTAEERAIKVWDDYKKTPHSERSDITKAYAEAIKAAEQRVRDEALGLVEALEFYGDKNNWEWSEAYYSDGEREIIINDSDNTKRGSDKVGGEKARAALKDYDLGHKVSHKENECPKTADYGKGHNQ